MFSSIIIYFTTFTQVTAIFQKINDEHTFREILSNNQQTYVLFTNASTNSKHSSKSKINPIIQAFTEIHSVDFARPPFLHVNCDIQYSNRLLQPVCRKYFEDFEKIWRFDEIQISKFKNLEHYDYFEGKRWPLNLPSLKLFFQENEFKKAPIGQRLGKYQKAAYDKSLLN